MTLNDQNFPTKLHTVMYLSRVYRDKEQKRMCSRPTVIALSYHFPISGKENVFHNQPKDHMINEALVKLSALCCSIYSGFLGSGC